MSYIWLGNVCEFQNCIFQVVILLEFGEFDVQVFDFGLVIVIGFVVVMELVMEVEFVIDEVEEFVLLECVFDCLIDVVVVIELKLLIGQWLCDEVVFGLYELVGQCF